MMRITTCTVLALWVMTTTFTSEALAAPPAKAPAKPPAPPAAPAERDAEADALLVAATSGGSTEGVLEAALGKIEVLIKAKPKSAERHYVRGVLLAELGRRPQALEALRAAIALDPRHAEAQFVAGVVAAELGRDDEAQVAWDAAVAADPRHLEALYRLAQLHYNRKQFDRALTRWSEARRLAPDDFDVLKKLIQTNYALGQFDEGAKLEKELFALWRASPEDRTTRLTEYVFDQFDVGRQHVLAFATLRQKEGRTDVIYSFRAAEGNLRVEVEASEVSRDAGTPYVLAVTEGGRYAVVSAMVKLPPYRALKASVIRLIGQTVKGEKLQP